MNNDLLHDALSRITGHTGAINYAAAGAVLTGQTRPLQLALTELAEALFDAHDAIKDD